MSPQVAGQHVKETALTIGKNNPTYDGMIGTGRVDLLRALIVE